MKPFDEYHSKGYQAEGNGKCGTPGQLSGITFTFPFNSNQDLSDIPYNKLVEVPFTVSQSLLCDEYVDLKVQIVCACEKDMHIYQYKITDQKIDYAEFLDLPSKSTGTFSVRWPPAARRMLSSANQSSFTTANNEFLQKLFTENEERMQRLLIDSGKANQTEIMQKLLKENEERMQRLLAENSKSSQAENEERMQRLLADSMRRSYVELVLYVLVCLLLLGCIILGTRLIFVSGKVQTKNDLMV